MSFPPLLILRHGETEWNVEGRLQGGLDSALTETGRAQAAQQARILETQDCDSWDWISSPQGRACATARIAGAGRAFQTDPRLAEIAMGDWSGQLRDELRAQHPALFESDDMGWYDHAPNGEGLSALATRVQDFLNQLRAPSVLITHGITSRVLRCLATGLPYEAFETVGGGQGVVYRVENGQSTLLKAPYPDNE